MMEFIVAPEQDGLRLDTAITSFLPEFSRTRIKKAIRDKACRLNDEPAQNPALRIKSGQKISINIALEPTGLAPVPKDVPVIWADSHLAIINKPAGLTVHPCPSCRDDTLAHRLIAHFPQLAELGGERPGIVHRLDKDTSGLMIIALAEETRLKLAEAFARRKVHKKYLALVSGIPPAQGECREPIGRHPQLKTRMGIVPEKKGGKPAFTTWRRLCAWKNFSLLEVAIHTGRTHQIRVHLAWLGFPILGDTVYASKNIAAMGPRQMLHSWQLALTHPESGEQLNFQAPIPQDFITTIQANMDNLKKIVVTGNPGCGKSTFCKMLASHGLPTISADDVVAELYSGHNEVTLWIKEHLGPQVLTADFSVDKKRLLEEFSRRPWSREELQKVIFGYVYEKIENFWKKCEHEGYGAAIAEIPLYFESGRNALDHDVFVIGVVCDKAERVSRLKTTRNWDEQKIETMEKWQWPEQRKMAACDLVIDNNGSAQDLEKQAREVYQKLQTATAEKDIADNLAALLPRE